MTSLEKPSISPGVLKIREAGRRRNHYVATILSPTPTHAQENSPVLFTFLLHITNFLCHLLQGVLEVRVLKLQLCSGNLISPSRIHITHFKRFKKIKTNPAASWD